MERGGQRAKRKVTLAAVCVASAILAASAQSSAPSTVVVLFHHTFDDSRDARWWMGYDYEIIDSSRHDGFTPVVAEASGGWNGRGYIWLDDTRWGIDIPDGNNILTVSTRRTAYNFGPDLRDATVEFWVRGQNLDLKGGYANLYIYHAETGTTTHMPGRRFEIRNGEWTRVRIRLEPDESLWYRSWWRAATGGNEAPEDLTYGGNQGDGFAPIAIALKEVDAIGIAFRAFDEEVTGRLDIDDFKVTRLVRTCRPGRAASCAGAFLSALEFAGADWRSAVLQNADLSVVNLRGADLRRANLRGADLRRARLDGAQLQGADLTEAQMSNAVLRSAVLAGSTLDRAMLRNADLSYADLTGASMRAAAASGANFFNARLDGAELDGADMSGADMRAVSLRHARAPDLILRDARLSRADLWQADLSRIQGEKADLSFADLSGARLDFAVLTFANLFRARLPGARLDGAILSDAQVKYATWTDGRICPENDVASCRP